ncbi:hypothetical protein [Tenacibaculum sp. SDUM215027]|uniref:hypothetical protein n=1 Tax=Tenacibaculum sp. SDUM215027 TaxID=3422596 RepID=UPI003D31DF3D
MQHLAHNNTIDQTKEKAGYFIQINNQNCHYEVKVNDFLAHKYIDPYPAYSVRPMLNGRILKSGKQTLSIRITPLQGEVLSKNADLAIRLLRYPNMLDKENEFGGSTIIMEWEMPQVKEELPYVQFDTIFNAEVPYVINDIDYAIDLSKMDEDKLLKEVTHKFKEMHRMMSEDYDSFNRIHKSLFERSVLSRYYSSEFVEECLLDNKESFQAERENIQPIENYVLKLYGNGKIATLERIKDGGYIIWAKDPETCTESLSLPLYIYKDKRDNQWHIW